MDAPSIGMIPSGYKDGKLYSVYPLEGLSEELLTSFTNGTTYPLDTFVSSGNNITSMIKSSGFGGCVSNGVSYNENDKVVVSFTYTKNSGNNLRVLFSSVNTGAGTAVTTSTNISDSGEYKLSFTITSTGVAYLQFGTGNSSHSINASITNVSIKKDTSADFDFVRGSLATRVNAQGLVEDVNIISEEIVQNGNFDEIGSEEVLNGNFSQEGSELITNGDFINGSTGWTSYGSVDISSGVATIGASSNSGIYQGILTQNKSYKVTFDVLSYNGVGNGQVVDDAGNILFSITETGSHTFYFKHSISQTNIIFRGTANALLSIDNASVVEVGQNWIFGTGWSISGGEAICNATGGFSSFRQTSILTSGKIYKITFDFDGSGVTSGSFKLNGADFGNASSAERTIVDGANVFYVEATSNDFGINEGGAVGTGIFDNISCKEVGQNWTFGTGWSMGDGKAVYYSSPSSTNYLEQDAGLTNGSLYRIDWEVVDYVGGTLGISGQSGSRTGDDSVASNGQYTTFLTSNGAALKFYANSSGSISNVSVKEITDATDLPRLNYDDITWQDALSDELVTNGSFDTDSDWNKNTGWVIQNGYAESTALNTRSVYQNIGAPVVGKTYKITYTILETNGGNFKVVYGGVNGTIRNSVGTYTEYIIATSSSDSNIYFDALNVMIGSIDNVSVKEVTGQEVASSGCPSLLLESQSSNLITDSEDFSDSSWFKASVTSISNQVICPDGSTNAYLAESSGTGSCFLGVSYPTLTIGNTYTFSCFAKKGNNNWIRLGHVSSSNTGCWFDLENGVVGTVNSESATIEDYGNGWYRITNTFVAYTSTGGSLVFIGISSADGSTSSGAIGQTNYVWGAQLEQLPYVSSYIPTNGSIATRLKDQAYRSGVSNLINSDEGVFYAEFSGIGDDSVNRLISLSDGTSDNRVIIQYTTSNNLYLRVISGGVFSMQKTQTISDITDNFKIAIKYKENDFACWIDGVEVHTDTLGATPIGLNRLGFDNSAAGVVPFHGKVKDLRVYTTALSDEDLQYLTS